MPTSEKLDNIIKTKEAIRIAAGISEEELFKNYPTKIQEKINSIGTSEDELLKMRTINNKLYLNRIFTYFPTIFNGIIVDAYDLVQKVQNSIILWCKENNLKNIYNMDYAFSYWNYGSQSYVNYDLDISNWEFTDKCILSYCFYTSYFGRIKLPSIIKPYNINNMFYSCSNLVEIEGIIDCTYIAISMAYTFNKCSSLEKVYIKNLNNSGLKLSDSPNLIKECILYLFENAKTSTTTRTLIIGPENIAKMEDEELAIITNKGYTVS